jgi:hypothetical protein
MTQTLLNLPAASGRKGSLPIMKGLLPLWGKQ